MLKSKLIILVALWVLLVCFGLNSLMIYKGKAGVVGQTPQVWPAKSLISRSSDKPLVMMFAHPRCPCTRASIAELEQFVAQANHRAEVSVVFYQPPTNSEVWSKSPLIHEVISIPGVRVIYDCNGKLAKSFGAETSGHTVVYGVDGRLLFSGGITASRGHQGDNAGLDAILRIIGNNSIESNRRIAPVFGCQLFDQCANSQTN